MTWRNYVYVLEKNVKYLILVYIIFILKCSSENHLIELISKLYYFLVKLIQILKNRELFVYSLCLYLYFVLICERYMKNWWKFACQRV